MEIPAIDSKYLFFYLGAINILALLLYGIDKQRAKRRRWRISEATLIWIAILGGSVGAFFGMKIWNHKTLHKKFSFGVPAILLFQLAIAYLLLQTSCNKREDTSAIDPETRMMRVEDVIANEAFTLLPDTTANEGNDSDFVILSDIVPDIIQEIRYYTTYNFIGRRFPGYEEPIAIITRKAANALKCVSDELVEKGYRLKVFDAYRPMSAVRYIVQWSRNSSDTLTKKYFYPDINKADLFQLGYISSRSAHSRGSTIDLTLFDMNKEKEVDMGGPYDFLNELSHFAYRSGLTEEQVANRVLLRETMKKYGFNPVSSEWWHFYLKDEPYPNTSFDFPVNSTSIKKNHKQH